MSNLEEINKKVSDLESIIDKQSKLIASTGQKLIEMQINDVKSRMKQIDSNSNSTNAGSIDTADYVNNDDIVQLVTELQSQLDFLEDRTIRRTYNTSLTSDKDKLAPLSNKDGDFPEFDTPKTFAEFKNLSKEKILEMGFFYEIILPTKEEIDEVLQNDDQSNEGNNNSKNDIINISKNKDISKIESEFNDDQINEIFDELARFFGLKLRRVSDGW
ncbi:MRP8 [Candida jiufengensis]|uniref:MRP8 n=1 Tax=Candida jiufengensis TaxID=497108 RepID=UPI0022241660|nr:MRP8 [Candida jiufengensis]KAI5955036.1 MRP8 [Candida jiufengensis]